MRLAVTLRLHTFGKRRHPGLLLLHGIGCGHRMWRLQIERFQATHFVIAPDIEGLASNSADQNPDIEEIAATLDLTLHDGRLASLSVCGISAGASVALALAFRARVNVRHLILFAPQARVPRFAMGLQIALCSAMPESILLRMARRQYGCDDQIAAAAKEDLAGIGKAGLNRAMRALMRLDLRDRLPWITASTTVICGSKDRANIPAARAIAATIPNATLHIEPGVGHLWNVRDPVRFNALLADLLQEEAATCRD